MTTTNHGGSSAVKPAVHGHRSTFVGPKDVHFVVNTTTHRLKCFLASGTMKYMIEARCEGVGGSYKVKYGGTPPGLYKCGRPEMTPLNDPQSISFGPWFVDLEEQQGQEARYGRGGVGVHGGGKGLYDPNAACQGWSLTQGCIRLQNIDLERFVQTVRYVQGRGGTAWLTVR